MKRRILSIILVLTMILSLVPTAFAAGTAKQYVSLGDAMTNGIGLTGYENSGYMAVVPDAYPAQVAAAFGWDLTQLATSSMRAEDLRYILEVGQADAYAGDGWTQTELLAGPWADQQKVAAKFQNSVAAADVITLAVGNTNFSVYMLDMMRQITGMGGYGLDYSYATLDNALMNSTEETKATFYELHGLVMNFLYAAFPKNTADALGQRVGYAMASFMINYEGALDRIVELNPDAQIVLVGLMSNLPGFGVWFGEGEDRRFVEVGELVGLVMEIMNVYLISMAAEKMSSEAYAGACIYYADGGEVEFLTTVQGENDNPAKYPSAAGHDQLTKAIVAAYNEGYTVEAAATAKTLDVVVLAARLLNKYYDKLESDRYYYTEDSRYLALGDATAYGPAADLLAGELTLGKGYANKTEKGMTASALLEKMDSYAAEIAKADLVTLGFGANALMNFVASQAKEAMYGRPTEPMDWVSYLGEEGAATLQATLSNLMGGLSSSGIPQNYMNAFSVAVESFVYAYMLHMMSYSPVIEAVHAINPEALVTLVGMHNSLGGLVLDLNGEKLDLGGALDDLIFLTNTYAVIGALAGEKVLYAAAPAVDVKTKGSVMNVVNFVGQLVYNPKFMEAYEPTASGYTYIKDQLLLALDPTDEPEHFHSYSADVIAPTCTEKGYTVYTCECGDSYTADFVNAKDHSWDEGKITTEPTEESTGVRTYTCTACGEKKTETVPVLEHTHKYDTVVTAPTCTEKGFTTYTCKCGDSYKGEYVNASGHDYSKVVTAPTETEKGYTTYTCHCGDSYVSDYTDPIGSAALLGDSNGDGKVNAKDAMLILRYDAELIEGTQLNLAAADVNGDGKVNAKDAKDILRLDAGLIDKFSAAK